MAEMTVSLEMLGVEIVGASGRGTIFKLGGLVIMHGEVMSKLSVF